jgi:WD40 repeat protein
MRTHRGMVDCSRAALGVLFLTAAAAAQDTLRVSIRSSHGQGDGNSVLPAVSADGAFVAFVSNATNLVASDTNGVYDVFIRDRAAGVLERISVDSSGAEADGASNLPVLTPDGQLVVFVSFATNLVAGDTNQAGDVFLHDRASGTTERVNVDSSGNQSDGDYFDNATPAISADGRFVAFASAASNLVAGDTNGVVDVFVRDRVNGTTERVSIDSTGMEGNLDSGFVGTVAISSDGRIVAFASYASNLVAGDANATTDIFVHDRATGITERVSVDSSGAEANGGSSWPVIDAAGQVVAFQSSATNLVANDMNHADDIFVHDRSSGATELVSLRTSGVQGNADSQSPSISADGRRVAFQSFARNLVSGDTNGSNDVFLRDRAAATTSRMSVDSSGVEGNNASNNGAISANGLVVGFWSYASNLVPNDTNMWGDAFVHELCSILATWTNYGAGFPGSNGVPAFTSRQNPVLGSSITLDLANSYGVSTPGVLFIGSQRTSIHSSWGGDLLVLPLVTLPVTLSAGGDSFTGTLPIEIGDCGATLDLQAIEADPGAAKGVSFTAGLELVLGE